MNDFDSIGFVIRSEYRKKVFFMLDKPIRPSEIAKKLEIRLTHITRELRYLKDKKLVECLNPNERTGRFYELTKKGKSIKKYIISKKIL